MITDLVQISRLGEKKREENKRLRMHMKSHPVADRRLRRIAETIESEMDCTTCANCCRLATVTLREREVESLAKFIGVSRQVFLQDYAEVTEEGLILKRSEKGCVFLEGNLCGVYDARPKTCETFPNLVRGEGSLVSRMWHMPDRATYCPIAYNTLEAFKGVLGFATHK
ncbi:MAG: YkgJ family cysteine cluster protein [Candidatus Solibacter usitatus]|nr:YkgJ family cysteine cluster protein [Candidatus Solibacter usitatus]